MQLSIVIPCLNEAVTIRRAVRRAFQAGQKNAKNSFEVVVADNGSSDGSVEIIRKQGLARIVRVPIKGYGAALHWGISKAKGKYVFFADADLSYDFAELKNFKPFFSKKTKEAAMDLVVGSRFSGDIKPGAMPFLHRYFGTPVLTFLIRHMYGINISDSNSGMRLVRKDFYKKLHIRNSGMEWASELLIKTGLYGGRYAEVPITLYKDQRNRAPHLLSWIDGWRHFKAIMLLKPDTLFLPVALLFVTSFVAVWRWKSVAFIFGLAGVGLLLCVAAAKLLQLAIDQQKSGLAEWLLHSPLVVYGGVLTVIGVTQAFFLPTSFLTTKLFLSSVVVIFDVWLFFIETIKTHLLHRLPERLVSK